MRSNFQPMGPSIALQGLLSAAAGFGFWFISIPLSFGYLPFSLGYGSTQMLILLVLIAFGMIIGYSATKIRSKLLTNVPSAHWAWSIVRGVAAVVVSYVLASFAVPTVVDYFYHPLSRDYITIVASIVLAVLVISPFCGVATEFVMSLEPTPLTTEEKHICQGESLKCPHCNAIYTYEMVLTQDGQVRCQNCGKTVSFNTAEIV